MIKWENVLVFDFPPICAVMVAWLAYRTSRRSEEKLHHIDKAVNGTKPNEPTLQANVKKLVEAEAEVKNGK